MTALHALADCLQMGADVYGGRPLYLLDGEIRFDFADESRAGLFARDAKADNLACGDLAEVSTAHPLRDGRWSVYVRERAKEAA